MLRTVLIGVRGAAIVFVGLATVRGLAADEPAKTTPQYRGPMYQGGIRAKILQKAAVVKDLNLADDQAAAIKKINDDANKQIAGLRTSLKNAPIEEQMSKEIDAQVEAAGKIDAVLSEKQITRFNEIAIQEDGLSSLLDPATAKTLNITSEQTAKIRKLFLARSKATRTAVKQANGVRKAAHGKLMQIGKDSNEKMLATLTPEQRATLEQMQGKKIDLSDAPSVGGDSPGTTAPDSKPEAKPSSK